MRSIQSLAVAAGLMLSIGVPQALAAPFGPATLGFVFTTEPLISFGATTGTLTLGNNLTVNSGTGNFSNAPANYAGTSSGAITFTKNQGTTIAGSGAIFTFVDSSSGSAVPYTFTLTQVGSTLISTDEVTLYLFGQVTGGGLAASNTSIVLDVALNTDGTIFNDTESLANPPLANPNAPIASPDPGPTPFAVPEPMSIALLAGGLAAAGIARRRRAN